MLFSRYSEWHRNQTHNGLAMMDVDKVECCIACNEPLLLAETVKENNQGYKKGHSMTRQLAIKANLPAFIVWYKFIGDMPAYVLVKKIAPDYKGGFSSAPVRYSFDQWLNYLEHKQVEHYPHCPKKDLFIKKISKDFSLKKNRIYAPILPI